MITGSTCKMEEQQSSSFHSIIHRRLQRQGRPHLGQSVEVNGRVNLDCENGCRRAGLSRSGNRCLHNSRQAGLETLCWEAHAATCRWQCGNRNASKFSADRRLVDLAMCLGLTVGGEFLFWVLNSINKVLKQIIGLKYTPPLLKMLL
jgi:hypothetical protein